MNDNDNERRRFFRIDDEVCLECKIITEEEFNLAPEHLAQTKQSAFALSADFATLNHDFNPVLNSIRNTSPDIAKYFELLNQKIDVLSQSLLDEEIPCQQENRCKVNISASGIAFESDDNFKTGDILKLRIILLPEKIGVQAYGHINHCNPSKDGNKKYLIGVDFEHIRNDDTEIMIRHNLIKQMEELRKRSAGNEKSDEDEDD